MGGCTIVRYDAQPPMGWLYRMPPDVSGATYALIATGCAFCQPMRMK